MYSSISGVCWETVVQFAFMNSRQRCSSIICALKLSPQFRSALADLHSSVANEPPRNDGVRAANQTNIFRNIDAFQGGTVSWPVYYAWVNTSKYVRILSLSQTRDTLEMSPHISIVFPFRVLLPLLAFLVKCRVVSTFAYIYYFLLASVDLISCRNILRSD